MKLVPQPLGGSSLAKDYLAGAESANSFYRGSPYRAETYRQRAEELELARGRDGFATVESVIRPAGPDGAALLRRVVAEGGYFVTTGQQPGLFGGPLYSLYKALTAVRLAADLEGLLARPVMPIFWIASDDHDWEEANHTFVVDGANRLVRLSLGAAADRHPRPLWRPTLGTAIEEPLERLAGSFPPNDFHARYMTLLRDAYAPQATMASAFAGLMAELLADTPVGLVDAGDPQLKEACREVFRAEAEDSRASETVLDETAEALEDCGYAPQVQLMSGATNLFVDLRGGRERLYRKDGGFVLGRSRGEVSRRRVLDLIENEPRSVSPNVLLRPVVESALFHTLAYVGGPGELAYFAQLRGLFRRHGAGMPVVVPRGSLLVVETKVEKVLDKHGLAAGDVRDAEALLSRFARDRLPDDVRDAVRQWRGAIESRGGELAEAAAAVDPALRGAVIKTRNSGLGALGSLEKKIVRAVKRNADTTRAQIAKAQVNLWPGGKPQDRILSPLQYLMKYGPGFPASALRRIRIPPGRAWNGGGFATRGTDSVA
ncbi:MAG: bacillithiol biosynthesis cysteine-adding enzyme BshC [Gemmatimonadetes bacterium]|nr:bacillithiol biosynthesis cysteine-adding enzyme BshC [Gemmatimonadota bacterium]MYB98595.1 bacillithiol biosynthesis cysteine-adding enzyme BshC [Gemmatimonadota bacterium]MYI47322.1 bacillithiol biosynthesis cysteine-adding enzyme BshC [Gemmatimonadota bacterium]